MPPGWIAVAHGVVNSFWLGQQRRDLMLALALAAAAAALAAGAFAPRGWVLEAVTLSQALPSLVALLVWRRSDAQPRAEDRALERYLLPGVVIGVLMGFAADGAPLVVFAGNREDMAVPVRTTARRGTDDVGRDVALLFEGGRWLVRAVDSSAVSSR